jgi:hypothetical protein
MAKMITVGSVGRPVHELMESHKNTYSDLKTAQNATVTELCEWIENGEVQPEDLSIRECFDALVAETNPGLDLRYSDFGQLHEAIISSQFPVITNTLIHSTFIKDYEMNMGNLTQLVTETDSKHREETYAGMTPGDRAGHVEEGAPISEIQIGEKYVSIPNKKFAKGVALTREMLIFDQTGDLVRYAKANGAELGSSLARFIANRLTDTAWDELDLDGTSRAYKVNGTTRAIYADTSAAWDVYANDNVAAAALPSISVVKGMRNQLKAMVNEKGERIVATSPIVFCNDLLEDDMIQFFQAQNFDITSANKDVNIYKGKSRVVVSPHFPSTTNWFMGDPTRQFMLQWVWRPRTETDSQGDPRRQIVGSWYSSFMCGVGAHDHRFVIKNAYAG